MNGLGSLCGHLLQLLHESVALARCRTSRALGVRRREGNKDGNMDRESKHRKKDGEEKLY